MGKRASLKLGEVSSLFIFYNIAISWLFPLDGFRFIFLLRDSENDLFTGHLDLCLGKPRPGKSRDYRDVIVYEKLRFQNVSRPHENKKIHPVLKAFSKSSFSCRISVDGRSNRRNKAAFS